MNHQGESTDETTFRSLFMGEFERCMWIGNLQSVDYVIQKKSECDSSHINAANTTKWTIISILESERLFHYVDQRIADTERHVKWVLPDTTRGDFLSPKLTEILHRMDKSFDTAGEACLVHCAMGISRSAAVCAAWMMRRFHHSLAVSMSILRSVRPGVQPNLGLTAALLSLQATHGDVEKAMERHQNHRETSFESSADTS